MPYVTDQLAMARLARATYALMVALLPALATLIGIVVLAQIPRAAEVAGVALVIGGVALHRSRVAALEHDPGGREERGGPGEDHGERQPRRKAVGGAAEAV